MARSAASRVPGAPLLLSKGGSSPGSPSLGGVSVSSASLRYLFFSFSPRERRSPVRLYQNSLRANRPVATMSNLSGNPTDPELRLLLWLTIT
jgi:hypothetical protein